MVADVLLPFAFLLYTKPVSAFFERNPEQKMAWQEAGMHVPYNREDLLVWFFKILMNRFQHLSNILQVNNGIETVKLVKRDVLLTYTILSKCLIELIIILIGQILWRWVKLLSNDVTTFKVQEPIYKIMS